MKLYLVQHGEAVSEEEIPERPLSDKGRLDAQRLLSLIARAGVRVARVVHSPKTRARDTAVLFARVLGPGGVVEKASYGLAPGDLTDVLVGKVEGWDEVEEVMLATPAG